MLPHDIPYDLRIVVEDGVPEDEVRFDMLDSEDFYVWAPRLGPTSMLLYINTLRYWPHRHLVDGFLTVTLDQLGSDLGVAPATAHASWTRLQKFRVICFDQANGFTTVKRWLPALPPSQLARMPEAWVSWYLQLLSFRAQQQGIRISS